MLDKSEFEKAATQSREIAKSAPDFEKNHKDWIKKRALQHKSQPRIVEEHIRRNIIGNLPKEIDGRLSGSKIDKRRYCILVSFIRYRDDSFFRRFSNPSAKMHWRLELSEGSVTLHASNGYAYSKIHTQRTESKKNFDLDRGLEGFLDFLDNFTLDWIRTLQVDQRGWW